MRPSSGTTRPSAPAALTALASHVAMSVGRVCIGGTPGRLLRGDGRSLLVDHAKEGVYDLGIELAHSLPVDFRDRLGDRPGRLVGTLLRERVEHVGHGHDPAGERNLILADARVAIAVPSLVVAERDFLGQ